MRHLLLLLVLLAGCDKPADKPIEPAKPYKRVGPLSLPPCNKGVTYAFIPTSAPVPESDVRVGVRGNGWGDDYVEKAMTQAQQEGCWIQDNHDVRKSSIASVIACCPS